MQLTMNLLIAFCLPLVITGNPTPGTYGVETSLDAQNPEASESEAYSKHSYGSHIEYKHSPLAEFAVDNQGEYYRKPLLQDSGAIGKPSIYNAPLGDSDQHPSFIAANVYTRIKDKATSPNKNALTNTAHSPLLEYGLPAALHQQPAGLFKLSNGLLATHYGQNINHVGASPLQLQGPLVPIAHHQPQLVQDPVSGQLLHAQTPLYQNVLVPIYHNHVAPAVYQPEVPVAQPVLHPAPAPLVHTPYVNGGVPLAHFYKTAHVPGLQPSFLKAAHGVEATIVPAVEEHLPETHPPVVHVRAPSVPFIAKSPLYTPFLPSDAIVGPKLLHKAILKSPVLAEKAVLKAALSYRNPALAHSHDHYYHKKAILRAPIHSHYVEKGYLHPDLPAKILSSQKSLVKALISEDTGKFHYGKGVVGLPPGTTVELVPSLSYGFSYSLYPKPNGLYGPPLPPKHAPYAEAHHHHLAHHHDHGHAHHAHGQLPHPGHHAHGQHPHPGHHAHGQHPHAGHHAHGEHPHHGHDLGYHHDPHDHPHPHNIHDNHDLYGGPGSHPH